MENIGFLSFKYWFIFLYIFIFWDERRGTKGFFDYISKLAFQSLEEIV